MPWWFYLIIVTVVLLLIPYIRFLFKRIALRVKLKSFCKKKGLTFHKTSKLWWMGIKKSGGSNFYIETSNTIYSVKLFPVLKRKACVHFLENNKYYVEKFMVLFGRWGGSALLSFKSRIRNIENLDFKYRFKEQWGDKTFMPVLLFNPSCTCVKLKTGNNERIICDGDVICEYSVFGVKGLISEISTKNG